MPVVNLTEMAAEKVQQLMERDGREGYGLRIKVVGGGCSGLQYQLMFDNQGADLDQESHQFGVRVSIDSKRGFTACRCYAATSGRSSHKG